MRFENFKSDLLFREDEVVGIVDSDVVRIEDHLETKGKYKYRHGKYLGFLAPVLCFVFILSSIIFNALNCNQAVLIVWSAVVVVLEILLLLLQGSEFTSTYSGPGKFIVCKDCLLFTGLGGVERGSKTLLSLRIDYDDLVYVHFDSLNNLTLATKRYAAHRWVLRKSNAVKHEFMVTAEGPNPISFTIPADVGYKVGDMLKQCSKVSFFDYRRSQRGEGVSYE